MLAELPRLRFGIGVASKSILSLKMDDKQPDFVRPDTGNTDRQPLAVQEFFKVSHTATHHLYRLWTLRLRLSTETVAINEAGEFGF